MLPFPDMDNLRIKIFSALFFELFFILLDNFVAWVGAAVGKFGPNGVQVVAAVGVAVLPLLILRKRSSLCCLWILRSARADADSPSTYKRTRLVHKDIAIVRQVA